MQVRKQQLELDMEQQTGSKLGKEYVKAVYCHPAYFFFFILTFFSFFFYKLSKGHSQEDSMHVRGKPVLRFRLSFQRRKQGSSPEGQILNRPQQKSP